MVNVKIMLPHQLSTIYPRQATGKVFSIHLKVLIVLLHLSSSISTALLVAAYRPKRIIQRRKASFSLHATTTEECVNYDGFNRTNGCRTAKCVIFGLIERQTQILLFRFDVNSSVASAGQLIRAVNTPLASKLVKKPSSPKASTTGKRR